MTHLQPAAQTIRDLILAPAHATPDAPAILAPGRPPLTYRGLARQVQDASRALATMGVTSRDRVTIVLPNGPEMAVAFLGVAASAVAAPLNPAYREGEFAFYLADLHARALILPQGDGSPARAAAQGLGIPVVEVVASASAAAGTFSLAGPAAGAPAEPAPPRPGDVALVLHTSGTTARPKIVPLTQANLCASAAHVASALALTAADRCLNVMPLFHIHGLAAALLASLWAGASVVCTPGFDATAFYGWLAAFRPTWFTAVPTMLQAIAARAPEQREAIAEGPLRFIRSCSAPLPPQVMRELEEAFAAPVIEAYGMTEAAHQIASNPMPPLKRVPGSVGRAAGPEVAVLDEAGDALPPGAVSEIAIRGPNVTPGYEGNPDANARAFTNGWFRTGDQGYVDAEGYIYLTGRLKEIINRGGEKVSPREVDEALLDHPAVAQAVAFALPDPRLGEDVAAAVVLREGRAASERELREHCARTLADFKVPSRIAIVAEIPKGATGKVQRIGLATLLGLSARGPAAAAAYVAPEGPVEELLAQLWAEVLGVAQVGAQDHFLYLGGDSLLATRIIARLRQVAGIELPLPRFFEAPTVAGQAAAVEELLLQERDGAGSGPPGCT